MKTVCCIHCAVLMFDEDYNNLWQCALGYTVDNMTTSKNCGLVKIDTLEYSFSPEPIESCSRCKENEAKLEKAQKEFRRNKTK